MEPKQNYTYVPIETNVAPNVVPKYRNRDFLAFTK